MSNTWKIWLVWHIPDFGLWPMPSFHNGIWKKSTLTSTACVSHLDKTTNGKRGISPVLDSLLHRLWYLRSIMCLKTVVDCEAKGQWFCDLFWDRDIFLFFLNNQPDALIIQIYSVIKLYMFWASSLPILRRFLQYIRLKFHAGFWWPFPSRVKMELPETCRVL